MYGKRSDVSSLFPPSSSPKGASSPVPELNDDTQVIVNLVEPDINMLWMEVQGIKESLQSAHEKLDRIFGILQTNNQEVGNNSALDILQRLPVTKYDDFTLFQDEVYCRKLEKLLQAFLTRTCDKKRAFPYWIKLSVQNSKLKSSGHPLSKTIHYTENVALFEFWSF